MKNIRLTFLCVILSFLPVTVNASHIVGMHITYAASGPGYDFTLKIYRDCSGIWVPDSVQLCFRSASGCSPGFNVMIGMDIPNSGFEVPFNPCQGILTTSCSNGSAYSFEEYIYTGYVVVPPCSDWIVSHSHCCRNVANTNLVFQGLANSYVETFFDNLNYPANSSPEFNAIPLNYYCLGIPAIIDYSAYDADGDSLSFEFTPVYDGSCGGSSTIMLYAIPYTVNQPLASVPPVVLDSYTGQIALTPSIIQNSVVSLKVNEYRNGQLIGSVRRDDAIVVVNGFVVTDTIGGRVFYDLNNNLIFDAGDYPSASTLVSNNPGYSLTTTSGIGKYEMPVLAGTHQISLPSPPANWNIIPATIAVTTSGMGTYYPNNDFALQSAGPVNDLKIDINSLVPPVPGNHPVISIAFENVGTTSVSNVTVEVQIDPGLQFVSATIPPTSIGANLLTWNIANLNLFASTIINITTYADTSLSVGSTLVCSATINPIAGDNNPVDNTSSVNLVVLASYDPNSKSVLPAGDLDLNFVTSQQWINYSIHFQNTGNAVAQIVKIIDPLDIDLEHNTVELVASSFPCSMNFTNPNLLGFEFFGINLPPAFVNEPASHGFVKFRIKPKATLQPGKVISNYARIVFDFNSPLFTNLVNNNIVVSTGILTIADNESDFKLYPNPARDEIIIEVFASDPGNRNLIIRNMLGQTIYDSKMEVVPGLNTFKIPLTDFNTGLYLMEFFHQSRTTFGRFLKL